MRKNIESLTVFFIFIILLICILSNTETVMESVTFSISIWKDNLFPTLFPFLIISALFMNYGISIVLSEFIKPFVTNVLHLNSECGFVVLASMFSGFPSSSKFIKNLLDENKISINEAEYLLKFCHFSNPLFVIGTIGILMLNNKRLGLLILICHYLGAFIIAFMFRNKNRKFNEKINLRNAYRKMKIKISNSDTFANVLKNIIMDSLNIMFLLLGIITVFLILSNIIKVILGFDDNIQMIISGILEMTQGIKYAGSLNLNTEIKAILMLAFISFGGLSIHTQIIGILENYKISYFKYFIARIFHIVISCSIFLLLYNFAV